MTDLARRVARWPVLRLARAKATALVRTLDRMTASRPRWLAPCALVFALQVALILTHEPWLDEFQAVQLAVQAPDIPALLEWLRYEGHPPLFYLILRGLAYLMDPLATLPALALMCAAVTQAVILRSSPFTRGERLLLATSVFVMFEFMTISRSLTLGVTVLFVAMAVWRTKWVWLAIALLPMCDFLFGVLSGVLALLKWRDKQLWWPGIALWLAIGVLAAWTVRPADDIIAALILTGFFNDLLHYLTAISTLLLPFQGGILPGWNAPPTPLGGILWIGFVWFVWRQTRGAPFHRLLLFGFIGLTFAFSMLVYPLAIRHLMLIALLLILLTWRRRADGERPGAGFRLWLTAASICGLVTGAINLVFPFDTASRAAAAIAQLGLFDRHWMVFPDSRAQGVAALSGIEFERTERHCMQSFVRWNYRTSLLSPRRMKAYLEGEVARHGRFYLLSDLEIENLPRSLLRPLKKIKPGYDGQPFFLYQVGPDAAEKPVALPRCVPEQRPFERLGGST